MELKLAFGNTLKSLRLEKGFTQEKLAELCNLDVSFISMLENGKRQPTLSTIFSIASALNVKASSIISQLEKNKEH
jgi:transcriptional regulator with XRE-family HTH domain